MAKKTDEKFVLELLTPQERFIIRVTREAEKFTTYAWAEYGEGWKEHIPSFRNVSEWCRDESLLTPLLEMVPEDPSPRPIVNMFTRAFLGFSFQMHQVELHYCPIPDLQIMGGVGAGKTTPCVMSALVRATINPGYRVLWVAPILSQAKLAHDVVMQWGAASRWGEVFLLDHRKHPYPIITFRKWDKYDPGSAIECRSLGVDPAEMLRGGEYDEAIADEAMRAYMAAWYIALLVGRLRGAKQYLLNANPGLNQEYIERIEKMEWAPSAKERAALQQKLTAWIKRKGISKQTRITVIGNAPRWAEWWDRWEEGIKKPWKRFSARWTTFGNAYITPEQIELQRQQYIGRAEMFDVELGAERPPAGGDIFPNLDGFFDDDLVVEAQRMTSEDNETPEPGWAYEYHQRFGMYYYRRPPQHGESYVFALDPGSGVMPNRNKWVLLGARIDKGPPFEIVYLRAGNLPGAHGSPDPWIHAAKDVRSAYQMGHAHFAVDATGTQKGTHQVVWGDDLVLTPIMFNNIQATLIVEAQRLVGAQMFWSPYCSMFDNEMSEFSWGNLRDKNVPNDFVSAFLMLSHLVYPFVSDRWEPIQEETWNPEDYWETTDVYREVRDTGREIRSR